MVSHDKLIEFLAESTNILIDATYKLNLYGFPVIIVGISDLKRKFVRSAVCIAENEDADALTWILAKLLEKAKLHPGYIHA